MTLPTPALTDGMVVTLRDVADGTGWLDVREAATYTSLGTSTIRKACGRRELRHVRVGHANGRILTRAEWVDAWMMQSQEEPAVQRPTVH